MHIRGRLFLIVNVAKSVNTRNPIPRLEELSAISHELSVGRGVAN